MKNYRKKKPAEFPANLSKTFHVVLLYKTPTKNDQRL